MQQQSIWMLSFLKMVSSSLSLSQFKGNEANQIYPAISAWYLPACNPLPEDRMWTCVRSEVKLIGNHCLHRKLQMRSGMMGGETGEASGKMHWMRSSGEETAHSVIHDAFVWVESISASVYFSFRWWPLCLSLSVFFLQRLSPTHTHTHKHLRADTILMTLSLSLETCQTHCPCHCQSNEDLSEIVPVTSPHPLNSAETRAIMVCQSESNLKP